jgi:hypothetical protein
MQRSEIERLMALEMHVAHRRFFTRVGALVLATVVLDAIAAVVAYLGEHGTRHAFGTVWAALFWTTTQMLTVSSQLPNPEHTVTKFLDVGLELWALVVVTTLAGTFADLLHHRTRKHLHDRRNAEGITLPFEQAD